MVDGDVMEGLETPGRPLTLPLHPSSKRPMVARWYRAGSCIVAERVSDCAPSSAFFPPTTLNAQTTSSLHTSAFWVFRSSE